MKANIKYKSVLQDIKNIEERNEAFHALDNQGKRLEIAWDMLQLVLNETISSSYGTYWSADLLDNTSKIKTSKELQKFLLKTNKIKNCTVCARGGIMLSTIRLGNKISRSDDFLYNGSSHNIQGFTMKKMKEMEYEYEENGYNHPYCYNTDRKLANICCNILVNGNFNIKDKTDYLS